MRTVSVAVSSDILNSINWRQKADGFRNKGPWPNRDKFNRRLGVLFFGGARKCGSLRVGGHTFALPRKKRMHYPSVRRENGRRKEQ